MKDDTDTELALRAQQVISNHLCNLVINNIRVRSEEIKDDEQALVQLSEVAEYHQRLQTLLNRDIDKRLGPFKSVDLFNDQEIKSKTSSH